MVVPIPVNLAIVAIPLVAIPTDHVAAVAVDAGLGGKAEPHRAGGCRGDPPFQRLLLEQHQSCEGECDHWLISSWRYAAARGLRDWPIQKIAFLRISMSSFVFKAISMSQR